MDLLGDNLLLCGPPDDFQQRELSMKFILCSKRSQFVSKGISEVIDFVFANSSQSVVVFCNSRHHSQNNTSNIKRRLDAVHIVVDVINIHGALHKIDKFWHIQLFCEDDDTRVNRHMDDQKFGILVTTNASNVGIDKHTVSLQVRFEFPRDLLTYFQESGQGSCCQGASSTCILYANLASYTYLMAQILELSLDIGTESSKVVLQGVNSEISPICQQRTGHDIGNNYKLGSFAKKHLHAQTSAELKEVLRFFCLDLGCQHSRGEIYLSSGVLDSSAPTTRCGTSCSICTRVWHKQFRPVYHSGVIEFIESLILSGKLPH